MGLSSPPHLNIDFLIFKSGRSDISAGPDYDPLAPLGEWNYGIPSDGVIWIIQQCKMLKYYTHFSTTKIENLFTGSLSEICDIN
jgi:hypothetical protein